MGKEDEVPTNEVEQAKRIIRNLCAQVEMDRRELSMLRLVEQRTTEMLAVFFGGPMRNHGGAISSDPLWEARDFLDDEN